LTIVNIGKFDVIAIVRAADEAKVYDLVILVVAHEARVPQRVYFFSYLAQL